MKEYSTIIRPLVTEKSSDKQAGGQYTFVVEKSSTKIDVKHAIKAIYGADVAKVKMMVSPSKKRMVGRGREITKRPVMKKAIVTLKGKQTIDPNKISDKKPKKTKK